MSVEFEARIAWLNQPTVDGRTFVLDEPAGFGRVPVTSLPFPLIALSGGNSDVVGAVRHVYLDGPVVRARGDVWMWDVSREVAQALQAGRGLACGINMLPVGGVSTARVEVDEHDNSMRIYDWAIAGLTVYLDDTRPAWPDACLRAAAQ